MAYHLDDKYYYAPPSNPFHNYSIRLDVGTPGVTFTFASTTDSTATFYFKIPRVSADRGQSVTGGGGYGGRTVNFSNTNSGATPPPYMEDPSDPHPGWQLVQMDFYGGGSFTISGTGDPALMGDDKTLCYISGLTINGQNIDLSLWFNNQNGQLADWVDPTTAASYAASLTQPNFLCTQSTGFTASWPSEFTLEGWVQTTSGGPLFTTLESPDSFNAQTVCNVAVMVNRDGSLLFAINSLDVNAQRSYQELLTDATEILDGEWHHVAAVRQGTAPVLYLDGEPVKGAVTGTQPPPLAISGQGARFTIGGAPPPYSQYLTGGLLHYNGPPTLEGSVDDVRMWQVAVPAADIAYRMHERLTNREPGLIGHWTFDNQTLADSSAPGGHDFTCMSADSAIQPSVGYVQSEVDFAPLGEPYLLTRAALMEDYQPPAAATGDFSHMTGYRVMISAKDSDGRPYLSLTDHVPATIKLWASSALNISFMDGTTATLGPTNGYLTTTDYAGELTFVTNANDQLTCPAIFVNASFMTEQERLVIFPDRHAHTTLASLNGAQLAGTAPLPNGNQARLAGVGSTVTQAQLDGAAQAISTLMNTGADLGLQSGSTPQQSPEALGPPITISTPPVSIPYRARYQNARLLPSSYNFATDAIPTHYLNSGDAGHNVERVLVPKNMPTRNWHFDLTTCTFTPLAAGEAPPLSAGFTVQPLDHVSPPPADAPPVNTTAEVHSEAVTNDQPAQASATAPPANAPSILSQASSFVMSVFEETVNLPGSIVEAVEQIVITVYQGAVSVANWTLSTIEDAILIVGGVLERIGSTISGLVKFVRNLFNWDDILMTQKVVAAFLGQMPAQMKAALRQRKSEITGQIDSAIGTVGTYITNAITALRQRTAPSPKLNAPESNTENIQSKYLNSLVSNNLQKSSDGDNPGSQFTLRTDISQPLSNIFPSAQLDPLQQALSPSAFDHSYSDFQSLAGEALAKLLEVVEALLVQALTLVKNGIEALFHMIEHLIEDLSAMLTAHINIPYVTNFYEKVVMKNNGQQLNLLGLTALGAAIPLTVFHKLFSNQTGPLFTEDDYNAVNSPSWPGYAELLGPVAGGSPPMAMSDTETSTPSGHTKLVKQMTWAKNFAYMTSTLFWGVACYLEDALYLKNQLTAAGRAESLLNRFPQATAAPVTISKFKMTSQFVANLTGFPVYEANIPTAAKVLNWGIYAGGLLAMTSNAGAAYAQLHNPAEGQPGYWWMEVGDPFVSGVYGAAQIVLYGALELTMALSGHGDGAVGIVLNSLLGAGEAFEWYPQLLKLVKPRPEVAALIPVCDIAAYGLVAAMTCTLTVIDMNKHSA